MFTPKHTATVLGLSLLLLGATGCSGVIHRPFSIDTEPSTSLSVDARQRLVLVTDHGGPEGNRRVVCSEPSPDVFSAVAASAAAGVNVGTKSGEIAANVAEQAAAIGPRTQTVQLLRDGLFRACEAYMNGIINGSEYRRIVLGYDETMITLLTLDGLTSRPQPVSVLRSAGSSASAGGVTVTSNPVSGPAGSGLSAIAVDSNDAQLAAAAHEILKSYYKFQLDLKKLFLTRKQQ